MSFDQFEQVWTQLVQPRLKGVRPIGPITVRKADTRGTSRIAEMPVELSNHKRASLGVQLFQTEGGPKGSVLLGALHNAWTIEFLMRNDALVDPKAMMHAKLQGLRKDRPFLESIGLKGGFPSTMARFMSWQDLEAAWQPILDAMEGNPANGAPVPGSQL